ncbi:MAG: hypothetical protein EA396_00495 [Anaerolineaceae bacterium]|nr:MAG: hypothetical protein EA396_00495 [Anaerolineaceae bacterium]
MIELYSLMLVLAAFCGFIGLLRGWNRELIVTIAVVIALFALFQFDSLLRGVILRSVPVEQTFIFQLIVFLFIVYIGYKSTFFGIGGEEAEEGKVQDAILGGVVGAINGYLIGGAVWYLLDINEYPFAPHVMAPAPNSASADAINTLPLVIISGGLTGSGILAVIGIAALILLVLFSAS